MIDPEQGWATERLLVEPLLQAHAAELFPLLDDPALHEFTGGAPLPLPDLLQRGWSPAARPAVPRCGATGCCASGPSALR